MKVVVLLISIIAVSIVIFNNFVQLTQNISQWEYLTAFILTILLYAWYLVFRAKRR